MELSVPVLIVIAIILIAIVLWLLFGDWGRRREEPPTTSASMARSVNLPSSADVEVPEDTAEPVRPVVLPQVGVVDVPQEPEVGVQSFTHPTEEITESEVLEADVMTTEVPSADVLRTEVVDTPMDPVVADRAEDLPLESDRVDDLEIIEGIGPKIRAVLNQAGVTRFAQLAAMEPDRISQILLDAGMRIADPRSWPEQARLAANGDMEGLKALQDRLTAGRS